MISITFRKINVRKLSYMYITYLEHFYLKPLKHQQLAKSKDSNQSSSSVDLEKLKSIALITLIIYHNALDSMRPRWCVLDIVNEMNDIH